METNTNTEEQTIQKQHQDIIDKLSDITKNDQIQQFRQLKQQFDQENFSTSQNQEYCLISTKWLNSWKQLIGFNNNIKDYQDQNKMESEMDQQQFTFGTLNIDLIDTTVNSALNFCQKDHIESISHVKVDNWNQMLKQQIQEYQDYEIVNEDIFNFFADNFKAIKINRYAYLKEDNKFLEVQLKRLNIFLTSNSFLKNIDTGNRSKFFSGTIQVPHNITINELQRIIEKNLTKYKGINLTSKDIGREQKVRIWKMEEGTSLQEYYKQVYKETRASKTYEYKLYINADLLNENIEKGNKLIEDCEIISESTLINIEIKENNKTWCFKNDQVPPEEKCEFCNNLATLKYPCACKKVAYCSDSCLEKDKQYHLPKCTKAGEEEEKVADTLQRNERSRLGIIGLRNLGNTCFMNSGLQCLQNCKPLTDHFLSNTYKPQINITNPLGTKGKLVNAYANLIKSMHFGNMDPVSPWSFKRILGDFQHIFSGYSQNDSQELVNFLLDGLHEDLNLVKEKQITEQDDNDGPKEYWDKFKQRNNSIITDLMYGQYKSKITCPDCSKVSTTYDPFLMLSVPIPQNKMEIIEFLFIKDYINDSIEIKFDGSKRHTLNDLKDQIAQKYDIYPEQIIFTMSTFESVDTSITINSLTTYIKRNIYKTLVARVISQQEHQIEPDQQVPVLVQHQKQSYFYSRAYSFDGFTYIQNYIFSSQYSCKKVHLFLFEQFGRFLDIGNNDINNDNLQNIYEELFVNQEQESQRPWRILLESNSQGWQQCYFCGQNNCNNCELPYEETLFQEFKQKLENRSHKLKFIIKWQLIKEQYKRAKDIFEQYSDELKQEMEEVQSKINTDQKMEVEQNDNIENGKIEEEQKQQEQKQYNPFGRKSEICLQDCLMKFEETEKLGKDNEWYCSNCKDHKQAEKQVLVYQSPKIMIIHFKRFKSGMTIYKSKIQEIVDFPLEGLEMDRFVLDNNIPGTIYEDKSVLKNGEQQEQNNKVVYDLFGVSNHYGSMSFGHYTAYAKNIYDNKWYYYDDCSVTEQKDLSKIVSDAAYILFYKRRD